jgi:hypothetical protein
MKLLLQRQARNRQGGLVELAILEEFDARRACVIDSLTGPAGRPVQPRAVPRTGYSSADVREAGLLSVLVNGLREQTIMVGSFVASGSRL